MPAKKLSYSLNTLRAESGLLNIVRLLNILFTQIVLVVNAEVTDYGTTAQRPTLPGNLHPGSSYFDTTLGKPIWVNAAGTGWVDATGTAV